MCGVFDPLGRHRRRELLEPHCERAVAANEVRRGAGGRLREEGGADEIEDGRVGRPAAPARARHGPPDVAAILGRDPVAQVRAVHRKARDHLGERLAQRVERVVAGAAVGAGEPQQLGGEHRQLRGEGGAEDRALAEIGGLAGVDRLPGERAPGPFEPLLRARVDQQSVRDRGEAVAGRAVHRPRLGQALVPGEDLLRHHPQRAGRAPARRRCEVEEGRPRVAALQPVEVAGRIVEPVGVIDAQAVDLARRDELEHEAVGRIEDRLVLHAEGGEVVDVEEAPVVDLVGGDAPEREPVRLRFQQLVQMLERARHARRAVEGAERAFDRRGRRMRVRGRREPALEQTRVAIARHDRRRRRVLPGRQVGEAGRELRILGERQDPRILPRVDRKAVSVIPHREFPGGAVEGDAQLAALQHEPVVVTENRDEHAARHGFVERPPVDVEEPGVTRGRAVLQHVEPPGVVGAHDPHVVGHHVDHEAHAVGMQRRDESVESLPAAELGVERAVVDDVVAVRAPGARPQDRGAIEVTDAEAREVGDDARRIAEREVAVELNAISRARDPRQGLRPRRRGRGALVRVRVRRGGAAFAVRPAARERRVVSHRSPRAPRRRPRAAARSAFPVQAARWRGSKCPRARRPRAIRSARSSRRA